MQHIQTITAAPALKLSDVKADLGVLGAQLDGEISRKIEAATAWAEGVCGGRSFRRRVRRLTASSWPDELPGGSGGVVSEVRFRPPDGSDWLVLDPSEYEVGSDAGATLIRPKPGQAWPAIYGGLASVEIEYETSAEAPPADAAEAILLKVRALMSPAPAANDEAAIGLLNPYAPIRC